MSRLLTLNAGSSSIKFSVYDAAAEPQMLAQGQVESLGTGNARLSFAAGGQSDSKTIGDADHASALTAILEAIGPVLGDAPLAGVGHRIVHGGTEYSVPTLLDDAVLTKLARLVPLAPLHQPHNLASVRAARAAFPGATQIGCFDTAFHRGHPWVNDTFALPRRFYEMGVRRYGFHGLSYDFITGELARRDPEAATGRVVVAHLGNGASMCAIRDGQSVGSTMGFSALDGLPMGTRCGQLDPGVLLYLLQEEQMDGDEIAALLYRESGLKGLSGLSHDMRTLQEAGTDEAAQAIDYFVFRIRRELGAMAAILGGLDTLIFTGGIGEHAAAIRARVCDGMDWLGIALDEAANADPQDIVSTGAVTVRVIPTDEERVIARAVSAYLADKAA